MTKHDFDFDNAMSVDEFFDFHEVEADEQEYLLKECTASDGSTFMALGLTNGETFERSDGTETSAMTFFVLSRKLEDKGEALTEDFLAQHAEDIQLLEPVDDLKFGVIFLATGSGKKKWADLKG